MIQDGNFFLDNGNSTPTTESKSDRARTTLKRQDYLDDFHNGTCRTKECIIAGSNIRKSIDSTIDPCTDFYDYVCGNSLPQRDPFLEHDARVHWKLRSMIENATDSEQSKVLELVEKLYNSCMNETEIEAVGMKPFKKIMRKIGGWPILEGDQWNETAYDWIESIRQMRDVGVVPTYLFSTSVEPNFENSSIRSLTVVF